MGGELFESPAQSNVTAYRAGDFPTCFGQKQTGGFFSASTAGIDNEKHTGSVTGRKIRWGQSSGFSGKFGLHRKAANMNPIGRAADIADDLRGFFVGEKPAVAAREPPE